MGVCAVEKCKWDAYELELCIYSELQTTNKVKTFVLQFCITIYSPFITHVAVFIFCVSIAVFKSIAVLFSLSTARIDMIVLPKHLKC